MNDNGGVGKRRGDGKVNLWPFRGQSCLAPWLRVGRSKTLISNVKVGIFLAPLNSNCIITLLLSLILLDNKPRRIQGLIHYITLYYITSVIEVMQWLSICRARVRDGSLLTSSNILKRMM